MPAILEYIPYRKNDATAPRDAQMHPYLAERGFAGVRVDLRGSGDSEGILEGEYLQQELDDGVEVIAWLAAQPWCSGRVGMIGKSWGGFNGLQIAALRPPALGCVISVCSTDDRYADDVHYTGGAVFAAATLSWATTMLAYTARPPDPAVLGSAWRERWLERLDGTRPFEHEWVAHQRRDAFWRHGSVGDDPGAIACHVELVGGFADPYRGAIFRMLEAAPDRVRGLIGPWAHVYPHVGAPGPAIGFLQRCVTVFDQHLRGGPGDDEPALRAFMPERVEPGDEPDVRPGRWVSEPVWPPRDRPPWRLSLGPNILHEGAVVEAELTLAGTLAHGSDGATWLAWGTPRRLGGRSACRGWPLAALRLGAARRAHRDPRRSRARRHDRPDRAHGPAGRAAVRRRARRLIGARHPRRPQPDASRRARRAPPARAGRARAGARAADGDRARLPGRTPDPAGARPLLLAVGVAGSGRARAAGALRQRLRARAAGASAVPAGCGARAAPRSRVGRAARDRAAGPGRGAPGLAARGRHRPPRERRRDELLRRLPAARRARVRGERKRPLRRARARPVLGRGRLAVGDQRSGGATGARASMRARACGRTRTPSSWPQSSGRSTGTSSSTSAASRRPSRATWAERQRVSRANIGACSTASPSGIRSISSMRSITRFWKRCTDSSKR